MAIIDLTRRIMLAERFGVTPWAETVPDVAIGAEVDGKPAEFSALRFHVGTEVLIFALTDVDRRELARLLAGGIAVARPDELMAIPKTRNGR